MAKYKYVDGVKYRVVPQSVLGYALVREDSDNSLPSGGTEGQVLGKASDADYDVEWMTVEGGGGESPTFVIDIIEDESSETGYSLADNTAIGEYMRNITNGKIPIIAFNDGGTDTVFYQCTAISDESEGEFFEYYLTSGNVHILRYGSAVREDSFEIALMKHTENGVDVESCVVTRVDNYYPGVG